MDVDVFHIVCLMTFGIMLILAVGLACEKRHRMLQSLKKKPDRKYVKKRLRVTKVFKDKLPEIERLAKKTLIPEEAIKGEQTYATASLNAHVISFFSI